VNVRFLDIDGIVDHHCLHSLYIKCNNFFYNNRSTQSKLTMKQQNLFFILISLIVSLLDVQVNQYLFFLISNI